MLLVDLLAVLSGYLLGIGEVLFQIVNIVIMIEMMNIRPCYPSAMARSRAKMTLHSVSLGYLLRLSSSCVSPSRR